MLEEQQSSEEEQALEENKGLEEGEELEDASQGDDNKRTEEALALPLLHLFDSAGKKDNRKRKHQENGNEYAAENDAEAQAQDSNSAKRRQLKVQKNSYLFRPPLFLQKINRCCHASFCRHDSTVSNFYYNFLYLTGSLNSLLKIPIPFLYCVLYEYTIKE